MTVATNSIALPVKPMHDERRIPDAAGDVASACRVLVDSGFFLVSKIGFKRAKRCAF